MKKVDSLCKLIYEDAKKVEGNESIKESAMQLFYFDGILAESTTKLIHTPHSSF